MLGIIYKATNIENDKSYIGQTIQTLEKRISKHKCEANKKSNYYFHNALRKYGIDCFEWSIIEKCENLDLSEQWYIREFDTYRNGYNSTLGGNNAVGLKHSEETKKKMSIAGKKRIGNKNGFYGKHHTKETKIKLSEANSGYKFTEEQSAKLSKALKGRKFSEEHKRKISEAMKGDKNPAKRPEVRIKISKAKKGKKHAKRISI